VRAVVATLVGRSRGTAPLGPGKTHPAGAGDDANNAMVEQTQIQDDVQALPDDDPLAGKSRERFGAHTFFVGEEGLHIVEEIEPRPLETGVREIITLAGWNDENRSGLIAHEPEMISVVVHVRGVHKQGPSKPRP
jgi:hypothetical protein